MMRQANILYFCVGILALLSGKWVQADDPYRYYTWTVTYGTRTVVDKPQTVILINGQFPGPTVECQTNDNIIVNIINKLNEPFLITWNGINQRKTTWQDGVLGTNCPIPPKSNWTYKFQPKDQIGTYTYFPSTELHKAAGGFGAFNVEPRSVIPTPYLIPDEEYTLLIGDWYKAGYQALKQYLDQGKPLPFPDALLINGQQKGVVFNGERGKTYKFRVSNVGLSTSINFKIQGHNLALVEVEGAHPMQEEYESLDVHVGQSVAVLVTLNAPVKDYYIVAYTRFTKPVLSNVATLRYAGSRNPPSGPVPIDPNFRVHWSMQQARTMRSNLTANAARPNPQGSFHYGTINVVKTLVLANSQEKINGKLRYAVNSISYVDPTTPLQLADWYNIPGVFKLNSIQSTPPNTPAVLGTSVVGTTLHDFIEIVFQNNENTIQSWHLSGYSAYVVGYGDNKWNPTMRARYNLLDAVTRHTFQVYPTAWTAIYVSLDNKGMWNLRSAIWPRRYLGQQLYIRVWNNERNLFTENDIPDNALFCGLAKRPHK